jgi:hypothetical protein
VTLFNAPAQNLASNAPPETSKNIAQIEAFYACADAYDAVERVMIDAAYRAADAQHEAGR